MPHLPALVELCLDNLALSRQNDLDPLTGLALPHVLLRRLCHDVDTVRSPESVLGEAAAPLHRACAGLVYAFWHDKGHVATSCDYAFSDALLCELARSLRAAVGLEILLCRAADDALALLLPSGTPVGCRDLAERTAQCIAQVALPHPTLGTVVRAACSVGYALYPQDIPGSRYRMPTAEQARMLLDRARLAAEVAARVSRIRPDTDAHTAPVLGYGHILDEGGVVRKLLPSGQVSLSLGRALGARAGMRFAVWRGIRMAGEVLVTQARERHSLAEVLHLADPAAPLEVGDALRLAPNAPTPQEESDATTSGLLSHAALVRQLPACVQKRKQYGMALLRLNDPVDDPTDGDTPPTIDSLFAFCRALLPSPPLLSGHYGENSLALVLPSLPPRDLWERLCRQAAQHGLDLAVGTAAYPCLRYTREDLLECCRKALDLALLLPPPRVGVFGSLALTISADKRYAAGDVFGAVDEYQLALLADDGNTLAWNSLGTCKAALARYTEARRCFLQALKRAPEDPSTLYNLGNVCQSLGSTRAAGRYYRKCVSVAPEHYFAHIRLGQLAEQAGRTRQARAAFSLARTLEDQARATPPDTATPPPVRASVKMPVAVHHAPAGANTARRALARLALKGRDQRTARELLHESLLRDAQDTAAMAMLAQIYLDSHEDPNVAEALARTAVALKPAHQPYRALLARALRALGREVEALAAEG